MSKTTIRPKTVRWNLEEAGGTATATLQISTAHICQGHTHPMRMASNGLPGVDTTTLWRLPRWRLQPWT